ncbi:F-box protein At1g55000 [Asparagus officinalis]|uniref:F-box protein At1g55000 n=1 Tax=Asparagus officinalis TaxID=4686 RepID=UPI00098E19C5|nr:F-box protein At1g55000 [Asparagus officinalis]
MWNEMITSVINQSNVMKQVPRPCRTRPFSGHMLVEDMLAGHSYRSYSCFRMSSEAILLLKNVLLDKNALRPTRYLSCNEQLCIFLYGISHALSNRVLAEIFQHSGETISRHFNNVLNAILSLKQEYIQLPTADIDVHPKIRENPNICLATDAVGPRPLRSSCRFWRFRRASDRELLELAFRKPWNVKRVMGTPSSAAFWRSPGLDRFAISHRLQRGDSVAGLALKYSVQVVDIKRLNNMMSEHGIYSRERLLIPISINKPEILSNSTCCIELDAHAKREVAVLYLDKDGCPQIPSLKDAATPSTVSATERRGRSRILLESVKRSMNVDDGTAEYYLSVSNGDPRAAIMQLSEDLSWEQQRTGH